MKHTNQILHAIAFMTMLPHSFERRPKFWLQQPSVIQHALVIHYNHCFIATPLKTRMSYSVGKIGSQT